MAMQRAIQRIHTLLDTPRLKSFYLNAPKTVDVEYANGIKFSLPAEFLRVYSPAADGKIRSISGEKVISGRRHVGIMSAEPVGNYGNIASALDEEDISKFTDVVKEFDSMTPLDSWKTTLLLRVKEKLKAKELEEDDLT